MSMPLGERRLLRRTDRALCAADPQLRAMFTIFTRLAVGEAMPRREQDLSRRALPVIAGRVVLAVLAALCGLMVRIARALSHALGHVVRVVVAACRRVSGRKAGMGAHDGATWQGSAWG